MAEEEKEDRISSLPDFLLLEIISRIKIIEAKYYEEEERIMTTKEVIRTTSTISKRWQHLWTLLPNLILIDRIMAEEEDRISSLPDCLLLEIISRLPTTKHAIKTTSTLSKRWQHLWTQCPNLTFLEQYDLEDACDDFDCTNYFLFIDRTLTQCPIHVKLNKFEFDICYNSYVNSNTRWLSHINSWIRYAITRNVQEVYLRVIDLEGQVWYDDELFFNNSCITSMIITFRKFNPPNGAIRWNKLKCLCISNGGLDEDMIETILSGSPLLETLDLHNCYGFKRIDVTSTSVKNLKFSTFDYGAVSIKINAPYILSLTINDCFYLEKLLLLNVSSLVKVHLYDYNRGGSGIESREVIVEEDLLKGLLQSLGHVNEIALWDYCLEVLSRLEAKGFQFRKGSDLISRDVDTL